MFHKKLQQYADLLIQVGLNLQVGQTLVISTPIECAKFVHLCTSSAYKAGCKEVIVDWDDNFIKRQKFLYAQDDVFDSYPEWSRLLTQASMADGAARLEFYVSDPHGMDGVVPERIARFQKSKMSALQDSLTRMYSQAVPRCTVSPPTLSWAKTVFPDCSDADALQSLWEIVFQALRIDGVHNPVELWRSYFKTLQRRTDILNSLDLKSLHYQNSIGTNLYVELPAHHRWKTTSTRSRNGIEYTCNMPSEEIYTIPHKDGVNGTVVGTIPLVYQGCLIQDYQLWLQDGVVTRASAKVGEDKLLALLHVDEGASRFGEVALIPNDSPIRKIGKPFYNPLYDENASCHFALGQGIPACLKSGEIMSPEQLLTHGVNQSAIHLDFMIGSDDLSILGMTQDENQIPIFINGQFAPDIFDVE